MAETAERVCVGCGDTDEVARLDVCDICRRYFVPTAPIAPLDAASPRASARTSTTPAEMMTTTIHPTADLIPTTARTPLTTRLRRLRRSDVIHSARATVRCRSPPTTSAVSIRW